MWVAPRRNPDAFDCPHLAPYGIHKCILPNHELSQLLIENAKNELGNTCVKEVLNASADSFYSSQVICVLNLVRPLNLFTAVKCMKSKKLKDYELSCRVEPARSLMTETVT